MEDQVNYELIQVDVFALASDGTDDPAGEWLTMAEPQELSAAPTVEAGKRTTERGGGTLAVDIKEPDVVTGGELGFKNIHVDPEAFVVMCGGAVITDAESPPNIIGYADPDGDETMPLFKMRIYAERYEDNNLVGYSKASFAKCQAVPPEYTFGQESVAIPSIKITAYHNANATGGAKSWREIEEVEAVGE